MEMIYVRDLIKNKLLRIEENTQKWAIYGTSAGAEQVWDIIQELNYSDKVMYFFDNDSIAGQGNTFQGYPISKMGECIEDVDIVIVGAEYHHRVVYERILSVIQKRNINSVKVIDPFQYDYTNEDKDAYIECIQAGPITNDSFEKICEENYVRLNNDPKIITWYLPQFHQMEVNNKYHGQGVTEWTNTSSMWPQYVGHYQPHIPYDVGYYDLLNPETLKRQIFLAKKYGIYGFGFFYYWFSGQKIMEKPIQMLLQHKELDIPFCLHWASEDWKKTWHSGNSELIFKQEIPEVKKFWEDIYPYFKDERYIKIDDRPLLIIYKCMTFAKESFREFIAGIRKEAMNFGFPDLYIMISTGDGTFTDADSWGGDALVEYQPWSLYKNSKLMKGILPKGYINPSYKVWIKDIGEAIDKKEYMFNYNCKKYFRSAMVSWDNSARKKEFATLTIDGNTPNRMKQWLVELINESKKIHTQEENLVFLSSWNEWGEGSHLEPDYKYGYAWLNAVKEAIETSRETS